VFFFTLKVLLAKNTVQQTGFNQCNDDCQHDCQSDDLDKVPVHGDLLALRIRSPCFLLAIIVRQDYRNIAGRLHFGKVREFVMMVGGERSLQDYLFCGRDTTNVDP